MGLLGDLRRMARDVAQAKRRRFVGVSPIIVHGQTPDAVTIGFLGSPGRVVDRAAEAVAVWQWAKIRSANGGDYWFYADLVDESGNPPDPLPDTPLTVGIWAWNEDVSGFTTTAFLWQCTPKFAAGQLVKIESRTGYRAGWWYAGDVFVTEPCP